MKFKAYFQDELNYLKDAGNEYARLNPKLAKYLSSSSSDPDIERLIEGFAYLTSRLRQTLDDELSDLTQSVLRMLWPGFLAPIPPLAMLKFLPVDRAITGRHRVEAGMNVRSKPIDGVMYEFFTTAACDVYPLELAGVHIERSGDRSSLTMRFKTLSGLPLASIDLDSLRIWFTGAPQSADTLYLWTRRYLRIAHIIGPDGRKIVLPSPYIEPGGFDIAEALLPDPLPAFDGYRLLQEYFAFPQKFRCLDLKKLDAILPRLDATEFSLEFQYNRPMPPEVTLADDDVQLYCTPIVNLCTRPSAPLDVSEPDSFYQLTPASERASAFEIFAIDSVASWLHYARRDEADNSRAYPRYESFNHLIEHADNRNEVYFRERLVPRQVGTGNDTFIAFVHHDGRHVPPDGRQIAANLVCFNPDASDRVGIGDVTTPTQTTPSFTTYRNITTPSRPLYPQFEDGEHWALISNLSQNAIDLANRDTLVEILRVYDYPRMNDRQAEHAAKKKLQGLCDLKTKPIDWLFKGRPVRGIRSTMEVDESFFANAGEMYLFLSVLAEFFSIYATQNSFHQLEVVSRLNGERYSWQPKRGRQPLL